MKFYAERLVILLFIIMLSFPGCKKKEKEMVDMNTINPDGSHDQRYIFREEIERDRRRVDKEKNPDFRE